MSLSNKIYCISPPVAKNARPLSKMSQLIRSLKEIAVEIRHMSDFFFLLSLCFRPAQSVLYFRFKLVDFFPEFAQRRFKVGVTYT